LEFGGPLITKEYYERTCAASVVVPVLRALFMRHTELSSKWFEIQSNYTKSHLFDGIVFYKKFKEPIALAEFGGALCDDKKTENDTVKVYRNACRVINELAAKTKKRQIPTVFIVLFHQSKLRFESLKLIDDSIYVRTNHAKIVTPTSPEEISAIFTEMPKVFGWRDAMIENGVNLYDGNSNTSTPNCTFDTSSVASTP
jgi:hypothetical protein